MNVVDIKKTAKEMLLARTVESSGVEYKKSSNFKDKILKTVCAFANNIMRNEINFLFVGVSEDSSELGGAIPDRVMQNGSNAATTENSSNYQRKVEKLPEKQEKLPEKQEKLPEKSSNTTRETVKEDIIMLMKEYPEITAKEMVMQLHVTEDGIRFHIKNMKKEGILKRIGSTKKGEWEVLK